MKKNIACLICIALFFSCAAHKKTDHTPPLPPLLPESQTRDTKPHKPEDELSAQRKIVARYAIQSIGAPYRWGGQSPETGFDCSGLTSYTHKKAGISIPRTARSQFNKGKFVAKKNLLIGDLVFFKSPQKKGGFHVGIYIFDGLFVHSPGKGSQVGYGDLNNPYFKKYYIGSRRYL